MAIWVINCLHAGYKFSHLHTCADPEGGGGQGVRFISNTGPEPLKNHKVTKPAFPCWAFCWRAHDDPLMVVLDTIIN